MKIGDRVRDRDGKRGTITHVQKNGIVYVRFDGKTSATRTSPGKLKPE